MDAFERKFGKIEGFRLIVYPVEAALPRQKEAERPEEKPKSKEKKSNRISREELYEDIVDSSRLTGVYLAMAALSTLVVIVGLLKNNPAVIIGAMVIAPFLGPNVALALSNVLADKKLGLDAFKTLVAGMAVVLILSVIFGLAVDVDPLIPEVASRTQPDMWDVLLALASGAAGVLAFTTGASAAVIGVMVAVALLPPLTVFGLLLGSGEVSIASGALLVFLTNIICINLSGVATFLIQGVTPRTWWEAKKAKKTTHTSIGYWVITLIILAILIYYWSQ
jgi:uncharacterized hydrophobic protein (TIGR00341 family)